MENYNQLLNFAKGKDRILKQKNEAVIYTRVSTKEQAENNASLETQLKYCKKYAEEKGLNVLRLFGGTYESAKDDERKEFQKMLTYVKGKNTIGFVLVYSYDRFSRSGPSGAFISHELKKKGIKVVSVTQSVDHDDPSGNFMEGIYHLFSEFDNQLRRDKSMTGMIEKLKQGYWPFMPPTGYTNLNQGKTADQHKLSINQHGKLLKKAFEWKAKEDISLVKISKRLEARGWVISTKRLTECFQNPFYCGIIVSKMIPGQIIDGLHPPLISKSLFLQVRQQMEKFGGGYHIEHEIEELPLKQFVKCDCCGTSMTGYLVKKKGLYYYKCNLKGCKNNRSQKFMHDKFESLLSSFTIDQSFYPVFKKMFLHILNQGLIENPNNKKELRAKLTDLKNKIEEIEERFVNGIIDQTLFIKYRDKYKANINQIELELNRSENHLSNLEKSVEKCLQMALNLPSLWRKSNFSGKQRIQNLLFPKGIFYNRENDDYRTTRINLIFSAIPCITKGLVQKKSDDFNFPIEIPAWVDPLGLEPRLF